MKKCFACLLLLLALQSAPADDPVGTNILSKAPSEFRTWTTRNGTAVRAQRYVTLSAGYEVVTEETPGKGGTLQHRPTPGKVWVTLKTDENKELKVSINDLSPADRQFIELHDGIYTPVVILNADLKGKASEDAKDLYSRFSLYPDADFDEFVVGAANEGLAAAQSVVGRSYFRLSENKPDAVRFDYQQKALRYLRDAAQQGNLTAQKALGLALSSRTSPFYDGKEAKHWLAESVRSGDAEALYALGLHEMENSNPALAADFFDRAGEAFLAERDRENALLCVDRLNDVKAQDFAAALKARIYAGRSFPRSAAAAVAQGK